MPHNISINQHLYVICDTPYVIHMLHTPFLHLVITVNQELGKESTKVFWGEKNLKCTVLGGIYHSKSFHFFTS